MSPLAVIAVFSVGVLLVLGIAYFRGEWRPLRSAAVPRERPTPPVAAMRFRLIDVDHAPDELASQTPAQGLLLRSIPGPDRPDYWLARLDRPLRWIDEGMERSIDHLVLAARYQGQSIGAGDGRLTVGVAYVVDPTLLADAALTFVKIRYVAIGTIERA
jgi:hypothetical protein